MKKMVCIIIICGIIFVPLTKADAQLIDTKIQGKLSLVILLTGLAVLTKMLVNNDKKEVEELHSMLGTPDRVIEFQKGFDTWRIEWYGKKGYLFRNEVLQNKRLNGKTAKWQGGKKATRFVLLRWKRGNYRCLNLNFCENWIISESQRKKLFMVE